MTEHKNVFCALAAAQMEMGVVVKDAKNPHFNSRYADLASVVEACLPALNTNGIALVQYTKRDEFGRYMTTALVHGATDTRVECDVELIIGKNDMQGYKSATTYAKRIGLESVTGLAPEDDDGNAAAKNAPTQAKSRTFTRNDAPEGAVSPRPTSPPATPTTGTFDPPHDPETGEVRDEMPPTDEQWLDENPGLRIASPIVNSEEEEDMPPPLKAFMLNVRKVAGAGADSAKLASTYAGMVIQHLTTYQITDRSRKFFGHFLDVHEEAIGKLAPELRTQVRSAIAFKQAMFDGKKPNPAEFGFPFGEPGKRMPSFVGEGG